MTPFYIIGSLFFIWAVLISVYGFKHLSGFSEKSVKAVAAVSVLLFAGTLTSAIWGAIAHESEKSGQGHAVTEDPGQSPQEQQ